MKYLSFHVITCLIKAIAAAIRVFVSPTILVSYSDPFANKLLAYGLAPNLGTALAVCSFTVIPMFAGIYLNGAGLGHSIAFLYYRSAINILAIVTLLRNKIFHEENN